MHYAQREHQTNSPIREFYIEYSRRFKDYLKMLRALVNSGATSQVFRRAVRDELFDNFASSRQ
jgi:hypothetical protein